MKYIEPSEKVERQLPSGEVVKNYGRSSKLLLAEKDIPDLHFDMKDNDDSQGKTDVMELMNVNTEDCVTVPWSSYFREHSRNLLENAVGEELELWKTPGKLVKQTFIREMHLQHSECREHSQNSRMKQAAGVEMTVSTG